MYIYFPTAMVSSSDLEVGLLSFTSTQPRLVGPIFVLLRYMKLHFQDLVVLQDHSDIFSPPDLAGLGDRCLRCYESSHCSALPATWDM